MAVISEDDFTEGSDVDLVNHTPTPTGDSWTEEENTETKIQRVLAAEDFSASNGSAGSDRHIYSIQPNPSVNEYDIEGTLVYSTYPPGSDDPWYFIARFTATNNYYSAGTYQPLSTADKRIFKQVSGTKTELASGDEAMTGSDALKIEVRDATKKLYRNGSQLISNGDDVIKDNGKVGFGLGNAWDVGSDDVRFDWEVDDFKVTTVDAAGADIRKHIIPAYMGMN